MGFFLLFPAHTGLLTQSEKEPASTVLRYTVKYTHTGTFPGLKILATDTKEQNSISFARVAFIT